MNVTAQIIVTPTGERLAVLPEAEYLALLDAAEDAGDREALKSFGTALAAGDEELLPAALVDRILDGVSPLRVWREHRGLTTHALAEQAGITQAYVSQIETGKRTGSVDTLAKLAAVLRVTIDDLVSSNE
jgi:DNA-binding XRE family transcriptional regulator